jgi:hypothetical protein
MAEILEHCTVKILGIIECDVLGNLVATDDILRKELFEGCRAYVCDGSPLNPFFEVFDYHNSEGVIARCWVTFAVYVSAPSLMRPGRSD